MSLLVRVGRHLGVSQAGPGAAPVSDLGKEVVFQDTQASGCVLLWDGPTDVPSLPEEQ